MAERVVLISIPQLRQRDVTPGALASLETLAGHGGVVTFHQPFPSLAAPAFASLVTGRGPGEHGLIGDAYFDRTSGRVVKRPFPDSLVAGPKLWDRLRAARPSSRSLAWFVPNARGAAVDSAAWVDETGSLMTHPEGLAGELESRFGPYRARRVDPSGEPLRLAATAWILKSAAATIAESSTDLAMLRVPYLGQVARRFGPDGAEACHSVVELEGVLRPFLKSLPRETVVLAVTESVSTPVTEPVYPNLVLRGMGLLRLVDLPGGGTDVDVAGSAAFALADHQLCHIYLNDPDSAAPVAAGFSGAHDDGVATVATGGRRARLGLDHPRAGDVILVASPDRWFAPDWWARRTERPISGLVPSGLSLGAEVAPDHIQGSLGAPPPNDDYLGVLVSSRPGLLPDQSLGVECRKLTEIIAGLLDIPSL